MQFDLTPPQRALQAKVRELARDRIAKRAAEIDRTEQYPWDNVALAAIKVTNDALQVFGAVGYSRHRPLERMVRDTRMFTIGGGAAHNLRTVVASRLLGRRLPQTRDGYLNVMGQE